MDRVLEGVEEEDFPPPANVDGDAPSSGHEPTPTKKPKPKPKPTPTPTLTPTPTPTPTPTETPTETPTSTPTPTETNTTCPILNPNCEGPQREEPRPTGSPVPPSTREEVS